MNDREILQYVFRQLKHHVESQRPVSPQDCANLIANAESFMRVGELRSGYAGDVAAAQRAYDEWCSFVAKDAKDAPESASIYWGVGKEKDPIREPLKIREMVLGDFMHIPEQYYWNGWSSKHPYQESWWYSAGLWGYFFTHSGKKHEPGCQLDTDHRGPCAKPDPKRHPESYQLEIEYLCRRINKLEGERCKNFIAFSMQLPCAACGQPHSQHQGQVFEYAAHATPATPTPARDHAKGA